MNYFWIPHMSNLPWMETYFFSLLFCTMTLMLLYFTFSSSQMTKMNNKKIKHIWKW